MKLKKNEVLVIRSLYSDGSESHSKYIFGSAAKGLRKNSRNLHFWDGKKWKHEEITVIGIQIYEEIETFTSDGPIYAFHEKYKIDGKIMTLTTSNCSGRLTPYWIQDPRAWW